MVRRSPIKTPAELLTEAVHAEDAGKLRKAAALYRRILCMLPVDPEMNRRAAPVLARTGQSEEAWRSYSITAHTFVDSGFLTKALEVYRDAARYMPWQVDAWVAIADLELERGQPRPAAQALLDGCRFLRGRRQRADAIRLLVRAREIDPTRTDAGIELARLWRKTRNREAARKLLDELALRVTSRKRVRRIRAGQFWLSPTPAAGFRWLRSVFVGR